MSTAQAGPRLQPTPHRLDLDPFQLMAQEVLVPLAAEYGVPIEALTAAVQRASNQLPARKREDVWKFPSAAAFERHIDKLRNEARKARREFALVAIDLRNVGGLNEILGETVTNEVIDALLDLVIAAATEICAGNDGADWQLCHYGGGDEYVLLLWGTSEYREIQIPAANGKSKVGHAHDVTRILDTLVRQSVQFAITNGLDMIVHPKRWWRIEWWGTGLVYAIQFEDLTAAKPISTNEMLKLAFLDCQSRKKKERPKFQRSRGLQPGEPNPLELSIWQQCRRMLRMPIVMVNKLFNTHWLVSHGWKSKPNS